MSNVTVLLSEFSERSEQPSAPDLLCSTHRTASPQLHQHHVSMSVSNIKTSNVRIINFIFQLLLKVLLHSPSSSPVLRDTLLLIERQSGVLENRTEHFFSSILSAMDSLTQPSPVQQSRQQDLGHMGVQGSTL